MLAFIPAFAAERPRGAVARNEPRSGPDRLFRLQVRGVTGHTELISSASFREQFTLFPTPIYSGGHGPRVPGARN